MAISSLGRRGRGNPDADSMGYDEVGDGWDLCHPDFRPETSFSEEGGCSLGIPGE